MIKSCKLDSHRHAGQRVWAARLDIIRIACLLEKTTRVALYTAASSCAVHVHQVDARAAPGAHVQLAPSARLSKR